MSIHDHNDTVGSPTDDREVHGTRQQHQASLSGPEGQPASPAGRAGDSTEGAQGQPASPHGSAGGAEGQPGSPDGGRDGAEGQPGDPAIRGQQSQSQQ